MQGHYESAATVVAGLAAGKALQTFCEIRTWGTAASLMALGFSCWQGLHIELGGVLPGSRLEDHEQGQDVGLKMPPRYVLPVVVQVGYMQVFCSLA